MIQETTQKNSTTYPRTIHIVNAAATDEAKIAMIRMFISFLVISVSHTQSEQKFDESNTNEKGECHEEREEDEECYHFAKTVDGGCWCVRVVSVKIGLLRIKHLRKNVGFGTHSHAVGFIERMPLVCLGNKLGAVCSIRTSKKMRIDSVVEIFLLLSQYANLVCDSRIVRRIRARHTIIY